MIIRNNWICLLFGLLYLPSIKPQKGTSPETLKSSSKCDPGLFSCVGDGQCIPMEWVGDNELDCTDGSDEHGEQGNAPSLPLSNKSKQIKQKNKDVLAASKPPHSSKNEEQRDVPSLPSSERPVPSLLPPEELVTCDNQTQQKVDACAKGLEEWTLQLVQTNFSAFSMLSNKSSIEQIERGCHRFNDYNLCLVDSLPTSCQPQNENVREFHLLQMYACELLVPSIKEHWGCFSALPKTCPSNQKKPTNPSPFCGLVDSVNTQIECIAKERPSECDEIAVELFDPMKTETQHSLEDLGCLLSPKQDPATSASIDQPVDQQPVEHEIEIDTPINQSRQVKPILPVDSIAYLSNSLIAFGNVEAVCSGNNKSDIWTLVRSRICARKNDLIPYAKCFFDTASQDKKCAGRLTQQTRCAAIDSFNKNVDCVITALNEFCPTEAQDVVVAIQEALNDDAIGLKCYEEKDKKKMAVENVGGDADFKLIPKNPRCNSEQENQALVCLVELIEINNKLSHFRSTSFLVEISDANSQLINPVCDLYAKYEKCLEKSVFNITGGQRCAFNSPLNTLARIGLSPICSPDSRQLLFGNKECLQNVSRNPDATQCQSGLHNLGYTVGLMLQGVHSEALLCNTFYMLRHTFECGEPSVRQHCGAQASKALVDFTSLKDKMTELAIIEGCPKEKPADLDAIIARPVNRTQQDLRSKVPIARPMVPIAPACEPEEQQKFGQCIQPLTAFQPHPLAVIKQPKEIDNACIAYKAFNECRTPVRCNPLWSRGMSAMFEFACGSGYERFNKVRQCIRKTTTREDVRECVNVFSKGAPQKACESSNRLLDCSLPPMREKCGPDAVKFVKEYVQHFASAIDPQCKLGEPVGIKAIHTHNCTANEDQIVQHCSAPLNDLGSRLEDLFQGGLQSFLKNLNNLAPVFAQGCNLTSEFRECAKTILDSNNTCIVSSCLIRAGGGICNQPDVVAAIDNQLGCIFKQVSDSEFGKCLRSTIATLKEFNLVAIKEVLPKFTSCVEPIVLKKCGAAPLDVLKALGSKDVCPVSYKAEFIQVDPIQPETPPVCTDSMRKDFENCSHVFYEKYSFEPLTILNKAADLQEICHDIDLFQECFDQYPVCEQQNPGVGLRYLVRQVCSSQEIFKQHHKCLLTVKESEQGKTCLNGVDLKPENACSSASKMIDCVAKEVQESCGEDSLKFMVEVTNEYFNNWLPSKECALSVPTVALETGCTEQQFIQYLECETLIDRYRFRPITFISNASSWDDFCGMISSKYRPCLEKLECRFEPISTASITLFENLCEREITRRDQRRHAECLAEVADSQVGRRCLEPYKNIDFLSKDAPGQVCLNIGQILACAGLPISEKCGTDALLHVYDIHGTWVRVFNSSCVLQPSEVAKTEPSKTETTTQTVETVSSTTQVVETTTTQEDHTKSTLSSGDANRPFFLFLLAWFFLL